VKLNKWCITTLNNDSKRYFVIFFLSQQDLSSLQSGKLNYIHLNPVRGNYKLVNDWREYEHSSAGFYELQQTNFFIPVHYKELQ